MIELSNLNFLWSLKLSAWSVFRQAILWICQICISGKKRVKVNTFYPRCHHIVLKYFEIFEFGSFSIPFLIICIFEFLKTLVMLLIFCVSALQSFWCYQRQRISDYDLWTRVCYPFFLWWSHCLGSGFSSYWLNENSIYALYFFSFNDDMYIVS